MGGEGVEDEEEKENQNGQNDQSDDVLLVLLPDEKHKGLHGVHKPVEGCLGSTEKKTKKERQA